MNGEAIICLADLHRREASLTRLATRLMNTLKINNS